MANTEHQAGRAEQDWLGPVGFIERQQLDDVLVAAVEGGHTEIPDNVLMYPADRRMVTTALHIITAEEMALRKDLQDSGGKLLAQQAGRQYTRPPKIRKGELPEAGHDLPSGREIAEHLQEPTLAGVIVAARRLERHAEDRKLLGKVGEAAGRVSMRVTGAPRAAHGDEVTVVEAANGVIRHRFGSAHTRNAGTGTESAAPFLWHEAALRIGRHYPEDGIIATALARAFESSWVLNNRHERTYPDELRDYRLRMANARARAARAEMSELSQSAVPVLTETGYQRPDVGSQTLDIAFMRGAVHMARAMSEHYDDLKAREQAEVERQQREEIARVAAQEKAMQREIHEAESSLDYGRNALRSPTDLVAALDDAADTAAAQGNWESIDTDAVIDAYAALFEQYRTGLTTAVREFPRLNQDLRDWVHWYLSRPETIARIADGFGTPAEIVIINNYGRFGTDPKNQNVHMIWNQQLVDALTDAAYRHRGDDKLVRSAADPDKGKLGDPHHQKEIYTAKRNAAIRAEYEFDMLSRGMIIPRDENGRRAIAFMSRERGAKLVRLGRAAQAEVGRDPLPADLSRRIDDIETWGRDTRGRHQVALDKMSGFFKRAWPSLPTDAEGNRYKRKVRTDPRTGEVISEEWVNIGPAKKWQ